MIIGRHLEDVFEDESLLRCIRLEYVMKDKKYLMDYLYFLVLAVIVQIFNLTEKVSVPKEIPTKEGKAEI